MSIQRFAQNFFAAGALVDVKTSALTKDGSKFLLALFNRTGQGTGIVPKVTPEGSLLVATGTTINDALQLITDWNWIGTAPANSGVQILTLRPGNDIQVYNGGGSALKVYPPFDNNGAATIQIDALGNGTPYSLPSGKLRVFECWGLNQLFSYGN